MLSAKRRHGDNPNACLPAPGSGISTDGASPVPFGCLKSAEGTPGPRVGLSDPPSAQGCWQYPRQPSCLRRGVKYSPSLAPMSQNQPW